MGSYRAPPVPRYCESTSHDNPNIEAVGGMLEQISCMYKALAGNTTTYKVDCSHLEEEIRRLRALLEACEHCKLELEHEIQRLLNELAACRSCLEEECHARMALEQLVAQLRDQINQIDQQLCIVTAERDQLLVCVEQLNRQLEECRHNYALLEHERDELLRNCMHSNNEIQKKGHGCEDLQRALAECCARVDDLTCQIGVLTAEIHKLQREKNDLIRERDELARKLQCLKEKCAQEKRLADEIIAKLKEQILCLEKRQQESCRKFEAAMKMHHDELNRLAAERDKYKKMYEDERRAREDAERRLRDCEERKQQQVPVHQVQEYQHQISHFQGACDQHVADIKRLEQERNNLNYNCGCLQLQLETVEREKVVLHAELSDLQNHNWQNIESEKETAKLRELLENSEKEAFKLFEQLEISEKQISKLRDLEDSSKEASKLHEQLESSEKEISKLREQLELAKEEALKLREQLEISEKQTASFQDSSKEASRLREKLENSERQASKLREELENYEKLAVIKAIEQADESLKLRRQLEESSKEASKLREHLRSSEEHSEDRKVLKETTDLNGNVENGGLEELQRIFRHETKKLKKLVNERDEQITALQVIVDEVKKKYGEQCKHLRIQKSHVEKLTEELSRKEHKVKQDNNGIEMERLRFSQEKSLLEREKSELEEKLKEAEKDKILLQNLISTKDRIENEVLRLKEAISQQFVDRSDVEQIRATYQLKLEEIKGKFEAQLEMNRQLAEINEYLGKQSKDRDLINQIRDSNEQQLRKELSAVSTGFKLDVEKLKKLLNEREEEILSLRKAVGILKNKYATEAQERQELQKKVQILSTLSQEAILRESPSNSNNNNVQY